MPTNEDEIEIGEIAKNKTEKLKITLSKFNGHDLISLRVWFTKGDDKWMPSNKGLAVNVRMLPDMRRLLDIAQVEIDKKGNAA